MPTGVPAEDATRAYLRSSGLQPLLAQLANAAARSHGLPPSAAIEAFTHGGKLKAGLLGSASAVSLSVGASPAGSCVLTVTVGSALGQWSGAAALRGTIVGTPAWAEALRLGADFVPALAAALNGRDPRDQAGADEAVTACTAAAAAASAGGDVARAARRAASIAVARAGAAHADKSLVAHISALTGSASPHQRASAVAATAAAAASASASSPALSFSVATGSADCWFPFRGLQLRCSAPNSGPDALLAGALHASAGLRARLISAAAATANPDGTLTPGAAAAPANRYEGLDAILRAGSESCSDGSAQLVLDMGVDAAGAQLFVSATQVAAEVAAAKAENDAFVAANPKAKPPPPQKPPPPAKGAPPPEPRMLWATDPLALTVAEAEAGKPLYVLARPSAEQLAAAAAAAAAWPGGTPGPLRLAVSSPRLVAVLADALAAHGALSGLVDPMSAADVLGMAALAARVSHGGAGKGKGQARISSSASSAAFGAAQCAGLDLAAATAAARAVGLQLASSIGASVAAPFDECETLTAALALCSAVAKAAPRAALVVRHSAALADTESIEADLCRAVGAAELSMGPPDAVASAVLVSRLMLGTAIM